MNRRGFLQLTRGAMAAGAIAMLDRKNAAIAQTYSKATRGLPALKITKVKTIATCPQGGNYVVMKVETSEPGLYGVGSATLTTRGAAVVTAANEFLAPFAVGRAPALVEAMWQTVYVSSYWRNGPILNGALCGLDEALWDIKAKRAGMPLYELLGGKSRFAIATYCHADGKTVEETSENVSKFVELGWKHVRIQLGGYGSPSLWTTPDFKGAGFGLPADGYQEKQAYVSGTLKLFDHIRKVNGGAVELIHDMHERIEPIEAVNLVKAPQQDPLVFAEDPLLPGEMGHFKMIRGQCSTPIAMGELFCPPMEMTGLVTGPLD